MCNIAGAKLLPHALSTSPARSRLHALWRERPLRVGQHVPHSNIIPGPWARAAAPAHAMIGLGCPEQCGLLPEHRASRHEFEPSSLVDDFMPYMEV